MGDSEAFTYTFTALRGLQAGREYFVAMCPLRLLTKIFLFDEDEIPPELRAQRTLSRARIPDMARYLVSSPNEYVFSSITASIDGEIRFEAFDAQRSTVGRLAVPMSSRFIINDGQHRRAAIEEALKERPELGEETISVVFFIDPGLERCQQMFADLNRHAVRPTRSIGVLYDHRDPLSQLARETIREVAVFRDLTEVEKTTISNRSRKLFTLSSIYLATRRLLRKGKRAPVSKKEAALAKEFWDAVAQNMPDWQEAVAHRVAPAELRRDYVHAHGVALQAIAIAGSDLIAADPNKWKQRLRALKSIDWSRRNAKVWEGRATVGGRLSKAEVNVQLTANVLKEAIGMKLSPKEKQLEERRGQRAA